MYMTITCTVHINIMYNVHDYHMYSTHYNACTCVPHVHCICNNIHGKISIYMYM